MHLLFILPASLLLLFCSGESGREYTGSTPAASLVRSFAGIPLADSIDFIRWTISLQHSRYSLQCRYGIGKPNTNGFVNGGKHIRLEGVLEKKGNTYLLQQGGKTLQLLELNKNLLHFLDEQHQLMVGNGGWSYTLGRKSSVPDDGWNSFSKPSPLPDSAVFQGRTPCLPFAYGKQSANCYKLKWWLVLYAPSKTSSPGTYWLKGTAVDHERKSGTWSIQQGEHGRETYRLRSSENEVLELVRMDDNILVFTDRQGRLLTGNEDFSYTLNRKL